MKPTEKSEHLQRLRLSLEEAQRRLEQYLVGRRHDVATYSRLENELLEAERKLALEMGEEAAMPWEEPPVPCSLTAIKIADGLRTVVLFAAQAQAEPGSAQVTAVLDFPLCLSMRHGWPNDEAIAGHPLHGRGLRAYRAFTVQNSKWIQELEIGNRVHHNHNPEPYREYKHYVLSFKDETVEVIARKASLEIVKAEVPLVLPKVLARLHFQ